MCPADCRWVFKVAGLKRLRVRDFEHNRLGFLSKLDGIFHMEMAAEDLLFRAHWGRDDAMDPSSLSHFRHVLNMKGIGPKMQEYNSSKRFTRICGEGFALALMAMELQVNDFESLEHELGKLAVDYTEFLQRIVQKYFVPRMARVMRERAEEKALREWENMVKLKRKKRNRVGIELDKTAYVKKETYKERDLIFENFVLFLQHYFVVRDFHTNVR